MKSTAFVAATVAALCAGAALLGYITRQVMFFVEELGVSLATLLGG